MQNFLRTRNPICRVHFAGFESDTLRLERAGWQLSMEQVQDYDGVRLRLALRHEAGRIHALSHVVTAQAFYRAQLEKVWEHIVFNIAWVGNDARFHVFPQPRPLDFKAVSAVPEFTRSQEIRFEDAIPFKPLNMDAPEIIVPPQSVPELMDMILKLQDPRQAEIRARRRREAWKAGAEPGASDGYSPAADIKAQIISLSAA